MAAKAKAVNATDDVRQVIKILEEKISKSYELCLRRRKETECYVQQCRSLLEPWPLKSSDKSEGNRQGSELLQNAWNVETNTGGTQVDSKAEEAESQELAALEYLLAKAQKAREVQAKLDEAATKAKLDGKISKKPLPVTSKLLQKKPGQQTTKENLPKASKPPSKRPASVTKPGLRKPVIKSTYSASYRRPPSAKSLVRPTSSRGSANKYLDSVLKKDDRRGTHSKVDHKEGGNILPRTGLGTGGKNSQKSKTVARNDSDEQECDTRKEDSHISFPSGEEPAVSSKAPEKADTAKRSAEYSGDSQQLSVIEKGKTPRSVIEIPGQSPELPKPAESFKTDEIDTQDQKEDSIDPLVDGVESGLPGKYRKLKATSVRLYSELKKIAEKGEGKSSLPWRNFVERLEAGFDAGHSSSHRRVQEKSNGLLEEHERLSLLTSAVVSRSNDLKDDSSWQDVYKCYRHWQIVLSKFNELQKRTQQLLEALT